MASFSCQVKCLWVRPGIYPRVEHPRGVSTRLSSDLTHKDYSRVEKLVRYKHFGLIRKLINCGCKQFYKIEFRVHIHIISYELLKADILEGGGALLIK